MQFLQPLFEFSGACSGCGETPYVKLLTQLFGDRALIANATGCSSIYGGNLPTTPYCHERRRPRPGLVQLAVRGQRRVRPGHAPGGGQAERIRARAGRRASASAIGEELAQAILNADQKTEDGIFAQRERVKLLKAKLAGCQSAEARDLLAVADALVKKSVWIIGGDGWAYDIGYGGLDHVIASGAQRQHPGAGHGGLFQHRRPGVQSHAARRGGQVRRRRQADGQERPGA